MPDSDLQAILFSGNIRRQRTSIAREYAAKLIVIPSGTSLSGEIDFRLASRLAVSVDDSMGGTYLTVYASSNMGGPYRPVYGSGGALITEAATAGRIIVFSVDTLPLGYICLASCSDNAGTLAIEAANRTLVVMLKP
jgi:hypothetical protein